MKQSKYINGTFAIIILLFVGIIFISYAQIEAYLKANRWVIHTYEVMEKNSKALSDLLTIELSARGFLITGDRGFLSTTKLGMQSLKEGYKGLQELTKDNPVQTERLKQMQPYLDDFIKLIQDAVEGNKTRLNSEQMTTFIYSSTGVSIQIRDILEDFYDEESSLLGVRQGNAVQSFDHSIYVICILGVASVIFVILIALYLHYLLRNLQIVNQKMHTRSGEIQLVNELNNLLASTYSKPETIELLVTYIKELLPFCSGEIYLLKASANYLEEVATWGVTKNQMKIFTPEQCWALRQGRIHEYYHNERGVICEHVKNAPGNVSYLCVPLLAHNEMLGVLYLELLENELPSQKALQKKVQDKKRLIEGLAAHIALAIANIRLHDVLKTRSTRDALTGLYNRAYVTETLDRDLERAKRSGSPICVVMMDLDHFKTVNDTYGHEAGDMVLKGIATTFNELVRHSDVACRYGGEEFLLVFYDTTLEAGVRATENLRLTIANLEFNFHNSKQSVTASFGISCYPTCCDANGETLIKTADQALYQAKHAGRNTVVVYGAQKTQ